ncbi:RnfH family protein [Pseudoduganella sp. UC29_71]|jgi:putative ubiquitin-RnfH superfamily antitoxin RatB of RatAB toxin-antitoxin module|uniref:RnfH family protein n=1 Tax=Pseudoduganella sp. UC29_71 TaxID=3350174 RepID=UPI00366E8098
MAAEQINIQVCYATDTLQFLRELRLEAGATIQQALDVSGLALEVPGIDLANMAVGIYGKKKPLDTVLREHDRVEVYRPLIADPKNARRRRVRKPE